MQYELLAFPVRRARRAPLWSVAVLMACLGGCAGGMGARSAPAESEGLLVAVVEGPDSTYTVSVREVQKPAPGASSAEAANRYLQAANRTMASRCGPTRQPELQTETNRQGVDGRDFSFSCGPVTINRGKP